MEKLKAVAILFIILILLIPVYLVNKYLQKKLRPRESGGGLMLYVLAVLVLIFGYTLLVVRLIGMLFAGA